MALIALLTTAPILTSHAATTPTCFGREPTQLGTSGDDAFFKEGGTEVFIGLQGSDSFDWEDFSGRDFWCGNSGDDFMYSGTSNDHLSGGGGKDHLGGGSDADKLFGGGGNDELFNAGDAVRFYDSVVDVLDGGSGFDTCYAESIDTVKNCEKVIITDP